MTLYESSVPIRGDTTQWGRVNSSQLVKYKRYASGSQDEIVDPDNNYMRIAFLLTISFKSVCYTSFAIRFGALYQGTVFQTNHWIDNIPEEYNYYTNANAVTFVLPTNYDWIDSQGLDYFCIGY